MPHMRMRFLIMMTKITMLILKTKKWHTSYLSHFSTNDSDDEYEDEEQLFPIIEFERQALTHHMEQFRRFVNPADVSYRTKP